VCGEWKKDRRKGILVSQRVLWSQSSLMKILLDFISSYCCCRSAVSQYFFFILLPRFHVHIQHFFPHPTLIVHWDFWSLQHKTIYINSTHSDWLELEGNNQWKMKKKFIEIKINKELSFASYLCLIGLWNLECVKYIYLRIVQKIRYRLLDYLNCGSLK
jgi:hypothetical protein